MAKAYEWALKAAEAAGDKKARDVVILDLQGITLISDYFVICSGTSSTQVQAIARNIEEKLEEAKIPLLRREGYDDAHWVLLDFGDMVVHIFREEDRGYYGLERLWGDARVVGLEAKTP